MAKVNEVQDGSVFFEVEDTDSESDLDELFDEGIFDISELSQDELDRLVGWAHCGEASDSDFEDDVLIAESAIRDAIRDSRS